MSNAIFTQTCYFTKPGPQNTPTCLDVAARRAGELGIEKILIATCTGKTALKALDYFDLKKHCMIAVSHVTGFIRPNEQEMPEQVRSELIERGFRVLTGTHAFGGIGRGVRNKLNTYQVDEIMAFTLRMLGQGLKVGVEIALMCADAGLVRTDEDVLTIAGTGGGSDTALIIKPSNAHTCLDLRIKQIIAKPF